MASDNKKSKADTTPKDAAPKGTPAKDATPTKDAAAKVESAAAKEASKPEGGETAATAAPANYSRGEGQKPVTAAYKENWNAIFAKKKTKKKKR
jgi:hypothetical protein